MEIGLVTEGVVLEVLQTELLSAEIYHHVSQRILLSPIYLE